MKTGVGIGITGYVFAERIKPDGSVAQKLAFPNVILNVGWDVISARFGNLSTSIKNYPEYLYLGTGTTEPSAEDLGLENISGIAGKYRTEVIWTDESGYLAPDQKSGRTDVTLRFDYLQGEATGTWTELGLAYNNTYINPFNRALFRDGNGDPISLTVLADEFLRITVVLTKHIRLQDGTLTFDFNGTTITTNPILSTTGIRNGTNSYSWWKMWPTKSRFRCADDNDYCSQLQGVSRSINISEQLASFTYFRDYVGANIIHQRIQFMNTTDVTALITSHLSPWMTKTDGWTMDGSWSIQFFRDCVEMDAGTATGGTASTLQDTTKTWDVNNFMHKRLLITGGTGEGLTLRITSNTADTLSFVDAGVALDNTSTYRICTNG